MTKGRPARNEVQTLDRLALIYHFPYLMSSQLSTSMFLSFFDLYTKLNMSETNKKKDK